MILYIKKHDVDIYTVNGCMYHTHTIVDNNTYL